MSRKFIHEICAIFLLAGILLGFAATDGVLARASDAQAADEKTGKVETLLLDNFASDSVADFIIEFTDQADLSPAYQMSWKERGWFVYNALTERAERSQAEAKSMLEKFGLRYQTYINGNELYVWQGSLNAAQTLAELPEVGYIRAARTYHIDPLIADPNPVLTSTWAGDLLANRASFDFTLTAITDWGILDTNADEFWGAFGYEGDGMVVANIDTGVQWNHPALDQSFKCGTDPTDPACWLDPSNICGAGGMCDNNGHGTHTMGTMVGDNDPSLAYNVGMAPNAQWIACKGCETNSCSTAALNACADWIIAPAGNPDNRPNVVNNSWGGGGGDAWYLAKVNAWRAAGIFPAFSAGNNYTCSNLGSPGDYQESFASAAHDINRLIAGFSSKGPSDFGHDPYTKPNISAPGVDVCSSVPGGSFECAGWSGTSMASPHSAGAVALLWSCNPSLVGNIDQTFQILQDSADVPPEGACGAPPDGEGNYTYGYGYLNVLAAGLQYCISDWGAIDGHVYNAMTSLPIEGATITGYRDTGGSWSDDSDASGYYTMTVGVGTYTVEASHPQYSTGSVSDLVVLTDTVVTQDFYLQPRGHLYGYVTDQDSGIPLAATVSVAGGPSTETNPADGYYEFYLDAGSYDVTASTPDYADETASVSLEAGSEVQQDFTLLAAIAVVPDPIAITLEMGQTGTVDSQMTNNMDVPYPFEFKEKEAQAGVLVGEDILVVRKDTTAATAMETALTTLEVSFLGVTDTQFQAMTVPDLLQYQAVFYAGITGYSGTPSASESLLVAYLDAGGQLYISDNDLGYYRHGSTFYDTYLQATYGVDNAGELLVGEGLMAGLNPDVTSDPYPDSFTVGAEGTRIFKWSTSDSAGGVFVQRNSYQAFYTSFDFQNIAAVADETELVNRIVGQFVTADVVWFDTSIMSGTVPAGGTVSWTDAFSATTEVGIGQPGEYSALLRIVPVDDPSLPDKEIPIHMTVLPSANFGQIQGTVTSDRPGGPLEAEVLIESTGGLTITLPTDPLTGMYSYWLEAGSYNVTASSDGYVPETVEVTIVGQQVTTQDFELALDEPEIIVTPEFLVDSLVFGQVDTQVMTISNAGLQPLTWELREGNASQTQINDILLMADDVSIAEWDKYRASLTAAGVSWDEWNLDSLPFPTLIQLEPYSLLIWADEDTVSPDNPECQIVADWLSSGGKALFATGIDFLWDLANGTPGSGENNLYVLFNTTYTGDYAGTGITVMNGVEGDPIGGVFAAPNGLTLAGTGDSNGDYSNIGSVATTGLIYGTGGAGSGYAGLTHYKGVDYKTVWLGVNFHNGLTVQAQRDTLMINILSFLGGGGDVPWLSENPTSGTVLPGEDTTVDVTFDSTMVPEPGEYQAVLRVMNNDPLNNRVDVPVTLNVNPSSEMGMLQGTITGDRPGGPLDAEVLIESSGGMTWTVPTDPENGYYYKWLNAGLYDLTASAEGYISQTTQVTIQGLVTTTQDFELELIAPEIAVDPVILEQTLEMGQTGMQTLDISNLGNQPLTFEIAERNGSYFPARAGEDILVVHKDNNAALAMESALTSLGYTFLGVTDTQFQAMTVDELLTYQAVFYAGTTGYSGTPTASETLLIAYLDAGGSLYISDNDLGFYRHGNVFYDTYLQSTYDIDNGGDYVDGLGMMAGLTLNLSTDPFPDGITVGAEGTAIFQFQGSTEMNGVLVHRNNYRVVYTAFDYQYLMDPANKVEVIDRVINAIAVSDAPWLTEDPITGTVEAGDTAPIEVTFDAGVASDPGIYTADLRVRHNDPLAGTVTIPVTLTVVPSAEYGRLEGIVSGLGYCDADPAPLEAQVLIEAEDGSSWLIPTDPDTGFYFRWMLGGTYTVTVSADEHLEAMAVVEITAEQTTVQDFDLRYIESCMDVTPTAFTVTLPADTQLTEPLSIVNDGAGDLTWEVHETTRTLSVASISIPRFTGTIPEDKNPVSFERAPVTQVFAPTPAVPMLNPGAPGYGIRLSDDALFYLPDLDAPGMWNLVGSPGVIDAYAGDFGPNIDTLYIVSNDAKILYEVDPATGTSSPIGSCTPIGDQTWTGMAWDPTTQTMYASATNGTIATLFTINLETGVATQVATITGAPYTIDIAIDGTGQMYGIDIQLDSLITIDKTTGATSVIGSIGFNANYAQGLDYDLDNNILYMAAYNYNLYPGVGEMRIVDTTTGNTLLLGQFPGGAEVDALAVEALGIPPWNEVPWVTEVPTNGVVGPDSSADVAVTFDATGLTAGECYSAGLGLVHDDPGWDMPAYIPLKLCVVPREYGVDLEPETSNASGNPGEVITYTLRMTNTGNVADSFELSFAGVDPGWIVELPVNSFDLMVDESVEVSVRITIPESAGDGDFDTFILTATSANDDQAFDEVNITTTAVVEEYYIFLPITLRN